MLSIAHTRTPNPHGLCLILGQRREATDPKGQFQLWVHPSAGKSGSLAQVTLAVGRKLLNSYLKQETKPVFPIHPSAPWWFDEDIRTCIAQPTILLLYPEARGPPPRCSISLHLKTTSPANSKRYFVSTQRRKCQAAIRRGADVGSFRQLTSSSTLISSQLPNRDGFLWQTHLHCRKASQSRTSPAAAVRTHQCRKFLSKKNII